MEWIAPTLADIDALARAEFATIPPELAAHVANVPILVSDFPDEETERALGLDSPFDILGLYHGSSLKYEGVLPVGSLDRIHLYRRPILDEWCDTGEDLRRIVRQVLIHEIGHHFGFSDEDMERIEAEEA